MTYYLLHLDESESQSTRIWALTGVCVPLENYDAVRAAFYDVVRSLIQPDPGLINTAPPELHGSSLLRQCDGVDDARRLEVARGIARLVLEQRLPILRYGRRYALGRRPDSQTLKGSVWLGLRLRLLQRPTSERFIPVMDGFDRQTVGEMSGMVRGTDVLHAAGFGDAEDPRFRQIIGEVFYADSRYSIMTQVADLVGYLRSISDKDRVGMALSDFARQLLAISRTLDAAIAAESIADMVDEQGAEEAEQGGHSAA